MIIVKEWTSFTGFCFFIVSHIGFCMKIAINVLNAPSNLTRLGYYCKKIIQDLTQIDYHDEYVLILSSHNAGTYAVKQDNVSNYICPLHTSKQWKYAFYEKYRLPRLLRRMCVDVLFSPFNMSLRSKYFRKITMIFDMRWFVKNKDIPKQILMNRRKKIIRSARYSDYILTLSEHSKQDIVKYTKSSSSKIVVTPFYQTSLLNIKNQIKKYDIIDNIKKEYKIVKPYLLFIGELLSCSNLGLVIEAMSKLKEKKATLPFQFVVAGSWKMSDKFYRRFIKQIEKMGCKEDVVFVNNPSDRILADLLYHARIFVDPSFYEETGFPIIEAFSFGVATIASYISFVSQTDPASYCYIDPYAVDDMQKALWKLWHDVGLRTQMIRKGNYCLQSLDSGNSLQIIHNILTNQMSKESL